MTGDHAAHQSRPDAGHDPGSSGETVVLRRPDEQYPDIGDYGFISDCHSVALVSRTGSIDWACMPRIDAPSIFARILDWSKGGFCAITPECAQIESVRRYREHTMVLETRMRTAGGGEICVTDAMAMRRGGSRDPRNQILRKVTCTRGEVSLNVRIEARFDMGWAKPWIRRYGDHVFTLVGGHGGLVVSTDFDLAPDERHDLVGRIVMRTGDTRRLSLTFETPELLDEGPDDPCSPEAVDDRLEETATWWRRWAERGERHGELDEPILRSALVLKALQTSTTGAITAAATTSLPEAIGYGRNWDYRFSWIRDSWLTVRSLARVGHPREAYGFRRFVERSAAGSVNELQLLYGVDGAHRTPEIELPELAGYRDSKPVRIGNYAATQLQLDMYGSLLELEWLWCQRGEMPRDNYWSFMCEVVERAIECWHRPDAGIWEVRDDPRHFVHSKVMCWVAVHCGLLVAECAGRDVDVERWSRVRDAIRDEIFAKGVSRKRGCFVASYGTEDMDASLLLLPLVGFIEASDPRMRATVDAVIADLDEGGLIMRYRSPDGLAGEEGAFLACSFWLVECLAAQGRLDEARAYFDRASATANDLGLFAEEFDTGKRIPLGNFPQGLSHLAHIGAALVLEECGQRG
jgi:GH15 family glucan-1,4-alpha-glucosidase